MKLGGLLSMCLLSFFGLAAGAIESPDFYVARAREFARQADEVNRREPKLTPNPRFAQVQKWTLRYQGFSQRPLALQFYRVFLAPPSSVRIDSVSASFLHLSREATELGASLLPQVEMHIGLIEDTSYKKDYVARYNQILAQMFPGPDGSLPNYQVFNCDYTSQPTNALWFMVNALVILDDYATRLYGDEWIVHRREMLMREKLMSVDQIRATVSPGVSLSPIWLGV